MYSSTIIEYIFGKIYGLLHKALSNYFLIIVDEYTINHITLIKKENEKVEKQNLPYFAFSYFAL